MKKTLLALLTALTLLQLWPAALAAPAAGEVRVRFYDEQAGQYGAFQETRQVALTLDGAALESDVPALIAPTGDGGGRTLVPLRVIAEALGAQVLWVPRDRQVLIFRGETSIALTLGSATALVDGRQVELPDGAGAQVVSLGGAERTMVPLRFVSQQLAARVDWDGTAFAAHITAPEEAPDSGALPRLATAPGQAPFLVAVDPGHGGTATGAYYEGVPEKDVNLAIALEVARLLEEAGCRVLLTRRDDRDVGLYERCALANAGGAHLFLSIHANAAPNAPDFRGTYTYTYPGSAAGDRLALCVQQAVCAQAGSIDRGIAREDFVVVRETDMPAALLETGFMTCREELERLTDPAYQQQLARGAAQGALRFLATLPRE